MKRVCLNLSLFTVVEFQTTVYRLRIVTKTNGLPDECIMLPMLISVPKRGLQHLWRIIYHVLTLVKLHVAGFVIGVKDGCKVRNLWVAKLRIVLVVLTINLLINTVMMARVYKYYIIVNEWACTRYGKYFEWIMIVPEGLSSEGAIIIPEGYFP